ncbi:hypothetical protein PHLCEN_2v11427 [Hermanssonia centrifuga]|uniref:Uncharacterized protein n=1 Tax=Hermanssonia centrifuga TaxID=98765 RepID=A0A2R6NL59_9APHY|nr:hypothetical protein PHLCEN_2v11427 [Hermanssonia centrifuga]
MNASTSAVTTEMMDLDHHLSALLESMSLKGSWNVVAGNKPNELYVPARGLNAFISDMPLMEDTPYQPNPQCSRPIVNVPAPSGCALLRQILEQLSSDRFPTTGGDYLETIFTHREVFRAFPQGHRECAVSFSDLANYLERREWRADRDSDAEAVAAFRHEAWVIANATAW